MKLKKVLLSFLAAAIAATTVGVTPLTASAANEDDTEVVVNFTLDYLSSVVFTDSTISANVNGQSVTGKDWKQIDRTTKVDNVDTDTEYADAFGNSSEEDYAQAFTFSVGAEIETVSFIAIGWSNTASKNVAHQVTIDASKAVDNCLKVGLDPKGDVSDTLTNNWYYLQDVNITYLNAEPEPYEGTVLTMPKNPYGDNYQGTEAISDITVSTLADVIEDLPTLKISFKVNGAANGNDTNFDVTKISYIINAQAGYNATDDKEAYWPWIVTEEGSTQTTTYDPKTKTVTISADLKTPIESEMTAKNKKAADVPCLAINLVAMVDGSNTTTTVKLYHTDIVVEDATVAVESVTVEPTTLELKVGDPASPLTAAVAPEGAPQDVIWASSNTKVATVSADGKVTAVASGVAEITATAKDTTIVGKCKVTVTNPATAITLDKTTLALKKGEADTLTATVTPTDADDEVEWTVAPSGVVTVDENGKVTAVKSGTATVTATAGTKSATCEVTVTNPATAIAIDKTAKVLVGATKTLAVTTTPADADKPTCEWTSSKPEVATVANGVVTGVAVGTTTITAKAGELTATCTVTVTDEEIPATAVTLNKTALDLEVEDTDTLTATLTPEDSTDDITWTSSAPAVATVDETGKVTAVAAGTATITATANATVKAECTVTVTAKTIAITGVTLDKTTASVEEGKTVELTATVKPADTTEDKTVTWTSSDTTVATVKDGVVTAVKAGKATITATAGTKTATCAVTVTAAAKPDEPTKPEEPTASDVLWEGNKSTGNWADYVQIEATELSEGDKIVVTLTPAANAQIALKNPTGNWDPLPGFAEIANQYGVVDITAGTSAFEYTLTAKDAEAISANGLVVGGQYYTVTKVERIAGTATAPTGYETGKVEVVSDYVPKTAGTQLIVRSITKAEAAQYESYTVTVTDSNGKKTTVTTNDCYKAFKYNTKDGAKTETAANGYFIIVKVTGVPAGTTVDIDIQPTK